MKQTVSQIDFTDAFRSHGRKDQFSYSGLIALFKYLESLEEDLGEELDLDVVALCCDYSEFATAKEAAEEYGWESDPDADEEDNEAAALRHLQDNTTVISYDSGVIIQGF